MQGLRSQDILKFMFSKKAKKLTKSSPSIWQNVISVKSEVKISLIFVAFLENTNFNVLVYLCQKITYHFYLVYENYTTYKFLTVFDHKFDILRKYYNSFL